MMIGNSQSGTILDEAVKYIRIMFFMGIPVTISMCIASSLRDMGKVRIPLYVTIAATLTNTTLNWLLIYGNLGFPKMGVEGAALATVIARILEFVIFAVIYVRTKPEYAVKATDFLRINRKQFKETLVKGSLVLFCEMVWVLSETITTAIYNGRGGGDTAMGAYADSLLTLFVMIPMVILLGRYTEVGPVGMYGCVKLIYLIKVAVFHVWLKKERWLKNLTGQTALVRS